MSVKTAVPVVKQEPELPEDVPSIGSPETQWNEGLILPVKLEPVTDDFIKPEIEVEIGPTELYKPLSFPAPQSQMLEHCRRKQDEAEQLNTIIKDEFNNEIKNCTVEYHTGLSQRQNFVTQKNQKMVQNNQQRKRALSNARVKKYRAKKRREAMQQNSTKRDEPIDEIKIKEIQEIKIQHQKELAREHSRRYRERKRLALKSVDHVVSQIPGPSRCNPPPLILLRNQRTMIQDSQVLPLVVRDDSENVNCIVEKGAALLQRKNFNIQEKQKMVSNNQQRKRALTLARVKKHRKKKRSEAEQLMQNEPNDEIKNKEIEEQKIQRKKELAKERSRRYRERKRLHAKKYDLLLTRYCNK